jgi:hypothetical protein
MLEPGTYRAVALEGALAMTGTGKVQVAVLFQLLDVPEKKMTWYGYFTDETKDRTFRALRNAGWKGTDLADLSDLSRDDTPEVALVIKHEPDQNDELRERVAWVNLPGSGGIAIKEALDADAARAFAAQMKGAVVAYDRSAGTPKAAPKRAPVAAAKGNGGSENPPHPADSVGF